MQISRLRVLNMCCAGEERLIRTSLEGMTGIESVAVSIVGKYVIIRHCAVECCAPIAKILDVLNDKKLGVTLQESADDDSADTVGPIDYFSVALVAVLLLLFILGVIFHLRGNGEIVANWLFISGTVIGALRLLRCTLVTLYRQTIDIKMLMIVAIAGALGGGEYFDSSLIVLLFVGAELFEGLIMREVRKALRHTSTGVIKDAHLVTGETVPVKDLKIGDVIAVRTGEMIPMDGIVVKGDCSVDESALTGESVPVRKANGDQAISGSVIQNGYIEIEVNCALEESTFQKLNQAVQDVQADKGHFARLVDQFAWYWTPGVLIATAIFICVGGGVTNDWLLFVHRGLVLLVLACPCAIVIAAPIPTAAAIAIAAKNGVLVKGSSIVERMATLDTVALDKTGTLTEGFYKVCQVINLSSLNGGDSKSVDSNDDYDPMRLAAALEQKSTHPLASAVVEEYCGCIAEAAEERFPEVRKFAVVDGVGVTGWVAVNDDWKHVEVGNERLLKENGGKAVIEKKHKAYVQSLVDQWKGAACSVLLVAIDDEVQLIILLTDQIRPESAEFIRKLTKKQLSVFMLTGDQKEVALEVCATIGIDQANCNYRLLPNEKLDWIRRTKGIPIPTVEPNRVVNEFERKVGKENKKVLMVGDGINDSTALVMSDVGVAMGAGGSAMAVQAADVVLMRNDLLLIPATIELCIDARNTVIANCLFAVSIKIVAIILALIGKQLLHSLFTVAVAYHFIYDL